MDLDSVPRGFFYTRPLFKGYQKNELKVFTDSLRYSIGGTGTGRIYLPSSFQKVSVRSPSNLPKCHQLARANKKFLFMCRCHLKTWCAPHFSWHLRDSTFRKVLATRAPPVQNWASWSILKKFSRKYHNNVNSSQNWKLNSLTNVFEKKNNPKKLWMRRSLAISLIITFFCLLINR